MTRRIVRFVWCNLWLFDYDWY